MQGKFITCICDKCKKEFEISSNTVRHRIRRGCPNYCPTCMKAYIHETKSNQFKNMSDDKKAAFIQKQKDNWENKSDEEKKAHSDRTKAQLASRTKEEQDEINKRNSDGLKRHWADKSEEYRKSRTAAMHQKIAEIRENMTAEERSAISKKWFSELSPEEQEAVRERLRKRMEEYNASLSLEEKQRRANHMNEINRQKSPEERADIYIAVHISGFLIFLKKLDLNK